MAIPPLILKIVADSSGVKKGVAESQAQVSGLKSSVSANAALMKTALVGGLVAGIGLAIKAAADLGESQNKANVVFGESVDVVNEFADAASKSAGLSKAAALEGASSFGAMFDSAGLAEKAAADMSVTMGQLAGDMASFNNEDPSEMLDRLRSGLSGEAEPLRRFGVFISEARVQTEAYKMGLAEVGAELTDAQKIQARYNIIMQDTAKQQGDFTRTLGSSLPNQLRAMKAEFTNLASEIGGAILPAMLDLVKAGSELANTLSPLLKGAAEVAGFGFQQLAEDVSAVVNLIPGISGAVDDTGFSFVNLGKAIQQMLNPFDKIANPSHLIPFFNIRDAVHTAFGGLQEGAEGAEQFATSVGPHGAAGATVVFTNVVQIANQKVRNFAGMTNEALKDFRGTAVESLRAAGHGLAGWESALTLTGGKTKQKMQGMADDARQMAKDYKDLDRTAVPDKFKAFLITEGPAAVHGFVTANKGAQKDIVQAWKGMQDSLQSAIQTMKKIASTGGNEVGSNLSRGVLAGIASQSASVRAAAQKVIADAIAAARAAAKAESPSRETHKLGVDLMQGLINGMESMASKFDEVIGRTLEKGIARFSSDLTKVKTQMAAWRSDISAGFSPDLIGGLMGLEEGQSASAFLAQQLASAQQFGGALKRLNRRGLNDTLLRDLAGQGPEALPLAQTLLGDQILLQQFNRTQAGIERAGRGATRSIVGAEFDDALDRLGVRLEKLADRFVPSGDVNLEIDGQKFASIARAELLKLKGSRVSLGLS